MANFSFCAQIIFCVSVRGHSETSANFFHCSRKIYPVWVQQNKVCPNRTMFDQLAAFQSCPKSANFNNFDNFHKKCWFWATLESCQSVKYCPIWTNFVLLNSHRVDLPRAMKRNSQKFQSAPRTDTQNMICAQNEKLAITPSNFIQ